MIKDIIIKEISEKVYTSKLLLSYVVIISLFIVNGFNSIKQYKFELEQYNRTQVLSDQELHDASNSLVNLTFYYFKLVCPPSVTNIASRGNSDALPNAAMFNYFHPPFPGHISLKENVSSLGNKVDWNFVVIILISFLSFIFSYDTFSREKKDGTLKLILSNSIPRISLFLGKYLSSLLLLFIPILIGILINVLQLFIANVSSYDSYYLLLLFVFISTTLILISINLFIGFLFSAISQSSSKSLNYCLLVWLVFVFIMPQTSVILAKIKYRIPTLQEFNTEIHTEANQILIANKNASEWRNAWIGKEPNERLITRATVRNEYNSFLEKRKTEYFNKCRNQAEYTLLLSKVSPYMVYQYFIEKIFNTGLFRLESFEDQTNIYRNELKRFIQQKDIGDKSSHHLIWQEYQYCKFFMSDQKVSINEIPKLTFKENNLFKVLIESKNDLLILFIWFIALFAFAFYNFNKLQVN